MYFKEVDIFPKRYCGSLWVNWLQSYKLSKLEDDPIVQESNPGRTCVVRLGPGAEFFVKPPTLTACNFASCLLYIVSIQRSSRISSTGFAHSNRPHLHWAYSLGV